MSVLWETAGLIGWALLILLLLKYVKLIRNNQKLRYTRKREQREFREILQKQQGMTFKFTKRNNRFIHTFCEGALAYKLATPPEITIGRALDEFIPDKDYVEYKESFYHRAWNGEEVSYEGTLNDIWYLASLRPIFKQGKVVEVIASCVDITQQKHAEEILRQSEQMYRLITESSADLIRVLSPDMTIQYASPAHYHVLGYRPEELVGIRCIELIALEERDQTSRAFREMVNEKIEHYQVMFHAVCKDGSRVLFETHGRPVFDERGNISKVVVVSRDITERVKSEEEYRRNDKLALAGQLAAGIAHEIRNPLTAMKGFIQLLQKPSEKQVYYTEIVLSELTRVESIVNEFLLLAKPQAAQYCRNDLRSLLRDVTTLMTSQALLQNVVIHGDDGSDAIHVLAIESQLKQVFINVLKNAIDAMPNGGDVYLTVTKEEQIVTVCIVDEGHGIPKERIPFLGEPFYTTKDKGTGLGLMVSYKIVRGHGGDIHIHSEEGSGTQVNVVLPLCSVSEPARA